MEVVMGVFPSRADAEKAIRQLRSLGIPDNRIGLLTPGSNPERLAAGLPVTDTEEPGMGQAMGAAVGGAMGAAGGATLGLAAATLVVPGIGPVLAFGMVGAALLGVVGAAAGAAVGDSIEEELGEGVPHEDIYLYQDALLHGRTIVIAHTADEEQAERAGDAITAAGAQDLEELRENWWRELKDQEKAHYQRQGRDFESDELSYRRGFQAALHPRRRGKSYHEVEQDLRVAHDGVDLDTAFREGYERGLAYQVGVGERRKG